MGKKRVQEFKLSEIDVKIIENYCRKTGKTKVSFFKKAITDYLLRNSKELKAEEKKYMKSQKENLDEATIQQESDDLKLDMKKLFLPRSLVQRIGALVTNSMFLNKGEIKCMGSVNYAVDKFSKISQKFPRKFKDMVQGDLDTLKLMKNEYYLKEFIDRSRFHVFDRRTFKTKYEHSALEDKSGQKKGN